MTAFSIILIVVICLVPVLVAVLLIRAISGPGAYKSTIPIHMKTSISEVGKYEKGT
jgi:hypothetical protein